MGLQPILTFLAFIFVGVKCQGDEPLLLSSDCCYRKTVGGILYNQVAGNTSQYSECKPDCVYERADEPGSRYCFKDGWDGDINNAGGVAECKETERQLGTTSMKKSVRNDGSGITDWVALQLDEDNYLNCSIGTNIGLGGNVTMLENITCVNETGGSDLFADKRSGDDFAHTVKYDNNLEFHMREFFIHCIILGFVPPFGFRYKCTAFLGQPNVVYVQDSIFNVTDVAECQDMCNNAKDCTFWTISLTEHDYDARDHDDSNHQTRVKRNHQGVSECGIRNYAVSNLITIKKPKYNPITGQIENVPDPLQQCGLKYFRWVFKAATFVQQAIRSSSPKDCAYQATLPAPSWFTFQYWKFWTFSFADNTCVFANYMPDRSITVLPYNEFGPLGITSGIVDKELLASWDSAVTQYPWMKSTPSSPFKKKK